MNPGNTESSDWSFVFEGYDPEQEGLREALCTLGNGYFATRGAWAESSADGNHYPGTYLAGGYNRLKTELAGRVIENEDLVNIPNWLPLTFRVEDGEWFSPQSVEIRECRQELNIQEGLLHRRLRIRDPEGRETRVESTRLVHMQYPHLAAERTTLTPRNWSGEITIRSGLDGRVENSGVERYQKLNGKHLSPVRSGLAPESNFLLLEVETAQSHLRLAEVARTAVFNEDEAVAKPFRVTQTEGYAAQEMEVTAKRGTPIRIEKTVALYTSRDSAISECAHDATEAVQGAGLFDELVSSHISAWAKLWRHFAMEIDQRDGNPDAELVPLALHLHTFHLLQTVSMHTMDLDVGVPSRGWHGEAYRGHIFWDELFIFPILNLRLPKVTRSLLKYRHRRLGQARAAAKNAGYEGAMFPWQSGSNGREETQKVHLNPRSGNWNPDNSHRQRHVNSAIVYNAWRYFEVTRDVEFLSFYGAELILDIAKFWSSIAEYNPGIERYEICGVMGPDEYHEDYPGQTGKGLKNNSYTNAMAAWTLGRALDVLELLAVDRRRDMCEMLDISQQDLDRWDHISRRMRLVFVEDDILTQFEGFDELEEFDWEGYREKYGDIQRLDRILEAEDDTPNRYQVSKQADVLMLFYLFSAEELSELFERLGYQFTRDVIPKNIEYHLKRTSHGSSLSRVVHSWVLARSNRQRSRQLFLEALKSDIADIQGGTTPEGIHLGAMAGTVDLVQRCFTGLEPRGGVLRFNPCLPDEIRRLGMKIRYRTHSLNVTVTSDTLTVKALSSKAGPISIGYRDRTYELKEGEQREIVLESASGSCG